MDTKSTFDLLPPLSPGLVGALAVGLLAVLVVLRMVVRTAGAPGPALGTDRARALTLLTLLAILLNPIRVDESPGPIERARVVYLLDSLPEHVFGRQQHALGRRPGDSP